MSDEADAVWDEADAVWDEGDGDGDGDASDDAARPPWAFYGVYLAAGLSSRFGYRIKCLQPVGRSGETLLELSVRQLRAHGVSALVLIVSAATRAQIHAVVGDAFLGLRVRYAVQRTPPQRAKPLGTVAALLAARALLDRPFVVLNGDTLYGDEALRRVCAHVQRRRTPCMPGYALRHVLPRAGTVNRALIRARGPFLAEIVEHYAIGMRDIRAAKYSGAELASMNIFGLQPSILPFAQRKLSAWLAAHPGDTSSEYILSTMLNDLLPEQRVRTTVYPVHHAVPLELTNPDDLAYVRNNLALVGL